MFCRIPTTPVPKETRTRLSRLMTLYVSRLLRVTNIKGNAAPHIMVVKAKMMMNLAGDLALVGETGLVMELRARKNSNAATARLYDAADRNALGGVFEMIPAESPSTMTAEIHRPNPPVAILEYKSPTGLPSSLLPEADLGAKIQVSIISGHISVLHLGQNIRHEAEWKLLCRATYRIRMSELGLPAGYEFMHEYWTELSFQMLVDCSSPSMIVNHLLPGTTPS